MIRTDWMFLPSTCRVPQLRRTRLTPLCYCCEGLAQKGQIQERLAVGRLASSRGTEVLHKNGWHRVKEDKLGAKYGYSG
jgi:uncharacterized metal-binding protein